MSFDSGRSGGLPNVPEKECTGCRFCVRKKNPSSSGPLCASVSDTRNRVSAFHEKEGLTNPAIPHMGANKQIRNDELGIRNGEEILCGFYRKGFLFI